MDEVIHSERLWQVKVVSRLFISDVSIPRTPDALRAHGITHVLSIVEKSQLPKIPKELSVVHKHFDIADDPLADILGIIGSACDWIESSLDPGAQDITQQNQSTSEEKNQGLQKEETDTKKETGKEPDIDAEEPENREDMEPEPTLKPSKPPQTRVLIHCTQSISRSPAILLAYLMRKLHLSYPSALALARESRPLILPNQGFAEQLLLWRNMGFDAFDSEGNPKALYRRWMAENETMMVGGEEWRGRYRARGMGELAARVGRLRGERLEGRSEGNGNSMGGFDSGE
ncbi:protein-tyrosine phosphatase-like protein [Dendryphion nanum]|uniref:protein-tyrosine-phosphatase n=1 Tax=Dendryphion nanum TaxID=256645 RepID=A0A9P9IC52_9PLEO|nr:protein-tyrosine phosphatase-like protein [Dendryphion nanum]